MKLYSIPNCPWCVLVKKRLDFAKIPYEENQNVEEIEAHGFKTVPQLEIAPNTYVDYAGAIRWVNEQTL